MDGKQLNNAGYGAAPPEWVDRVLGNKQFESNLSTVNGNGHAHLLKTSSSAGELLLVGQQDEHRPRSHSKSKRRSSSRSKRKAKTAADSADQVTLESPSPSPAPKCLERIVPRMPRQRHSVRGDAQSKLTRSQMLRPEPEGGEQTTNSDVVYTLDECDRILNCDNQLFSDVEPDEELDKQIEVELDRLHKRSTDVFAVAQMIQSNTLLKFAIIQTELKNVTDSALRRVSQLSA